MRRVGNMVIGTALAAILVAATPTPTLACVSEQPSFAEAVRGAGAIARVTVVEGWDSYLDDSTHSETFRVERLLKGSLPPLVTIAPAWTTLCQDTVSFFAGSEGATIVVAFDLDYYGQVIHPMWTVDASQGVSGSAGVPGDVATLADLEAAIRMELGLPDTATPGPPTRPVSPLLPIVLAALSGFALGLRRFNVA